MLEYGGRQCYQVFMFLLNPTGAPHIPQPSSYKFKYKYIYKYKYKYTHHGNMLLHTNTNINANTNTNIYPQWGSPTMVTCFFTQRTKCLPYMPWLQGSSPDDHIIVACGQKSYLATMNGICCHSFQHSLNIKCVFLIYKVEVG